MGEETSAWKREVVFPSEKPPGWLKLWNMSGVYS